MWDAHPPYEAFKKLLALIPPKFVILDAGCGPGHHTRYLVRHGHDVTGIDLSEGMLSIENIAEWLRGSCGFHFAPKGNDTDHKAYARIFVFVLSRDALATAKLMELVDSVVREIKT